MTRITATKNLSLLRHRGEVAVDEAASSVRSRFATADKYQIYADKRNEALLFLQAIESATEPDDADYPYLSAETGISAATMLDLASMWLAMDVSWRKVAALIEKITQDAKIRIRQAGDEQSIASIRTQAADVLGALGTPPPAPPKVRPF
jgi:hypothetical protein